MSNISYIYERRAVNTDTGEIKIIDSHVCKYWDDERGYLFWPNRNKFSMFTDVPLPKGVTDNDYAKLCKLAHHLKPNTNIIVYRGHSSVCPATIEIMAKKYLDITPHRAVIFINKMIRLRVIAEDKSKTGNSKHKKYLMNPLYFICGKWVNANLYFAFAKDLDPVIPDYVKVQFIGQK